MADYEARVFLIGSWRNFEHLEENLSLPEIKIILETHQELKRQDQAFMASLQGIDLEAAAYKAKIKQVKERAQNRLHGEQNWETASLADLGMVIEEEFEEEGTA